MTSRVVYMGTPAFACPALSMLASKPGIEVAMVVTQPDRPAGRGRKLTSPPVKVLAEELRLPAYQVASLRTADSRQPIVDIKPDLIVVAAFGLILGRSVLDLPGHGCINLHASLLPKYRGASPIAAAILEGESHSGVSLMRMERGLDTGPVYEVDSLAIDPADTTESLTENLARVAADLLARNLDDLLLGARRPVDQGPGATLTRPLTAADGWIDWSQPADAVERRVRAMWPWPRAWTTVASGERFQIHRGSVVEAGSNLPPGTVTSSREGVVVACGRGALRLERGQLAGRNALEGRQLSSLRDLATGIVLGLAGGPGPQPPIVQPVP